MDVENLQRTIAQKWLGRTPLHASSNQCVCVETSVNTHLRSYERQWWARRHVDASSQMEMDDSDFDETDSECGIVEVGAEEGLRLRREHM